MKVAILAGGKGTRMFGHDAREPKALVEIGGRPILWHILDHYARFGLRDFVVALGHAGERVRGWFEREVDGGRDPGWRVDLVDTGEDTPTGGRVLRIAPLVDDGTFILTWCDALADLDVGALLAFHRSHGRLATLTAVHPTSSFGHLRLAGGRVEAFVEKPRLEDQWVNGAFFVLEPGVIDLLDDATDWDRDVLPRLAREGELMAFRHESFWQCMDTAKDARLLDDMWRRGGAPWNPEGR